ncbi:MAG: hypothetical protein HQL29_02735 [Candidatus Omnitrophica bacterium]|nr:hypothetical protein [Candidatus Omnitrophota bacterium]
MKNFCLKKIIIFGFSLFFFLSAAAQNLSAENMDFLRDEIKETQRHLAAIEGDHVRAKYFLEQYPIIVDEIANTAKEVRLLKEKMNTTLHNNLVKSTIALGIETAGKIGLVIGFYQKSFKIILMSCAVEYYSDKKQKEYSSEFEKAVKPLSDQAAKMMPEIAEINDIVSMDIDEVKEEALLQGDKLGDTGALYRKFTMILQGIEDAEDKMIAIRRTLDQANHTVESIFPALDSEVLRLTDRIKELQERLNKAEEEKARRKEEEIENQVDSRAQVNYSPVPIRVSNADEAEALKKQLLAQLSEVISRYYSQCAELDKSAGDITILQFDVPPEPGAPYTDKDIEMMDPVSLKREPENWKRVAELYEKYSKQLNKVMEEYKELENSFKGEIAPILGALAGLGVSTKGPQPLLEKMAAVGIKYPGYQKFYSEGAENIMDNIKRMKDEFGRKKDMAINAGSKFETNSQGALNALRESQVIRKQVIEEARSAGMELNNDRYSSGDALAKLQKKIKEMFVSGQEADDVAVVLREERDKFIELYKRSARSASLERLAEKLKAQAYSISSKDPGMGYMAKFSDNLPDEGVVNTIQKVNRERNELLEWSGNGNVWLNNFIVKASYSTAKLIDEMIQVIPVIKKANEDLRSAYSKGDHEDAYSSYKEIMSRFDEDAQLFHKMLDNSVRGTGGNYGFRYFISSRTKKVMEDAEERFRKKQLAEQELIQAELKEKAEKEQKEINDEYQRSLGYHLGAPSINGVTLPGNSGEVLLMKNDLKNGQFEINTGLNNLFEVKNILVSENGSNWEKVPIEHAIKFYINPADGTRYSPKIKLEMLNQEDKFLDVLGRGQTILFKNVDRNSLVVDTVMKTADAYEKKNLNDFMKYISREFSGNKSSLEEGVRYDFEMFNNIRLKIFINKIEVRNALYIADIRWDKTQSSLTERKEQKTGGNTIFTMVMEDGVLKIKNMRGNLLYATLSPEIAESSGLNSKVVDAIREARNTRKPTQPGSESEGAEISTDNSRPRTGTARLTVNIRQTVGFDLSSGTQTNGGGSDFVVEFVKMFFIMGNAKIQDVTGRYTYDSLDTAPDIVDEDSVIGQNGSVFLVLTNEGYYAKLRVETAQETEIGKTSVVAFTYAVQTDGSRNLKTN